MESQSVTARRPPAPALLAVVRRPQVFWGALSVIAVGLIAAVIALLIRSGAANSGYNWGWYVVTPWTAAGARNSTFLLRGLIPTVTAAFAAFGLSIGVGLVVALVGFIPSPLARGFNRLWVEVFRSVPVLVMLLWVYYGLAISIGLDLNLFAATVVAMALCDSAFEAEIFRGGIQGIARSQIESARAIALTPAQTMRIVILPQAFRHILPPLGNQFVYMLKVSSLASVIGFGELTRKANELITTEYRPLEIYTFLILEYLVLILLASAAVRFIERKLREATPD
ncbi:MAG: amino acid ABC transporter permease [Spirochaeta sp.]|jgi:His/Glu/Gln/Arg/opine family amino acid ABC transporter permease subunit|nr:amino acid ABC transporter permease [Spirochaeta sp.]